VAERDAIIYIPGLFHDPGESIETVSRNIAAALDTMTSPELQFTVSSVTDEPYGYKPYRTRTATIVKRQENNQEVSLIDIYETNMGAR
jgi:hypothetical protein